MKSIKVGDVREMLIHQRLMQVTPMSSSKSPTVAPRARSTVAFLRTILVSPSNEELQRRTDPIKGISGRRVSVPGA